MPKSSVRAVAEAAIFQCVVYDSKSRKRAIAVYACGADVVWADDVLSLFDHDKRRPAPDWLKAQIRKLPDGVARYNWKGEKVSIQSGDHELQVPRGDETSVHTHTDSAPVDDSARGEDLGEAAIQQVG